MSLVVDDLEGLLDSLGLEVGRRGLREVWSLCPAHDDSSVGSFSVNRETGESYCFSCGWRGGDLTALVRKALGVSQWEAAGIVNEHGGYLTKVEVKERPEGPDTDRKPASSLAPKISLEGRFAVYTDPPDAALELRKLTREAVDYFEIRWDLEDRCFVIPIRDLKGNLAGWQRRTDPEDNYPYGLKKKRYMFGAHEFVGDTAVLMESPLDVVRLWSEGYDGGLASFGAVVSDDQMRIVRELADRVILALDDDEAGHRQTERLSKEYFGQFVLETFNYGESAGRGLDPGDLRSYEIKYGMENAEPVLRPARRVVRR